MDIFFSVCLQISPFHPTALSICTFPSHLTPQELIISSCPSCSLSLLHYFCLLFLSSPWLFFSPVLYLHKVCLNNTQKKIHSLFCEQQITDEGLITICRGCHRLQSLCVSGCANITDAILHALGQNCPRLRYLHPLKNDWLIDRLFWNVLLSHIF